MSLGWVLTAIGATEAMALSDRISLYRISEADRPHQRRRRPRAPRAPRVPHRGRAAQRQPPPARRGAAAVAEQHRERRPHRRLARAARLRLALAAAASRSARCRRWSPTASPSASPRAPRTRWPTTGGWPGCCSGSRSDAEHGGRDPRLRPRPTHLADEHAELSADVDRRSAARGAARARRAGASAGCSTPPG